MKDQQKKRPENLNLLTIRFPLPAIASILHRISGVILFLMIPLLLYALHASLASQSDFDALRESLTSPLAKLVFWILGSAFIYHFIAGIRHLLMDINIGIELKSGKLTALITLILSVLLIVLMGIWLW